MSEPDSDTNHLSRRTTPTWEMELLISGATVFGLLQLPQPLNQWLLLQIYSNESVIAELMGVMGIYLQFSLITLIVTFILHLIARGYWVALVGMSSVYPKGIRWDKSISLGPIYHSVVQKNMPSMPELIENADNRATRIFGIGFSMAVIMMLGVVIVGIMIIFLMFGQARNADLEYWSTIMWSVLSVIFLPYFIFMILDYSIGRYLKEIRWLNRIITFYHRIGFHMTQNPLLLIYSSNEGAKKSGFIISAIIFLIMAGLAFFNLNQIKPIDNGAYDVLPADNAGAEHVILPQHYASLRAQQIKFNRAPFIDDTLSQKPYLKLFIPYHPGSYSEIVKKECPETLTEKSVKAGLAMQCFSRLQEIKIDGEPIEIPLLASEDALTGLRGMVAMIDVRHLSKGMHVLTIKRLSKEKREKNAKDKTKQDAEETIYYQIPFWR